MSSKWTSKALTDRMFPSAQPAPFGRRLGRARGARLPVTLVTGFLGAGKTTLVKRFLSSPEGAGAAVIVNEFGEVGIDNALLRESSERTVLLGNGCICCSMRSDLESTLAELLADAATGRIPSFDRVVIETSGLADPGPVLQTFAADRGIGREMHLDQVLTVADATSIEATFADAPEARRQLAVADRIVLTKTDLASPDDVARVSAFLREQSPAAEVLTAVQGDLSPAEITRESTLPRRVPEGHVHHSDGIETFVLGFDAPLPWSGVLTALQTLMDLRGPDILRVKGLLAVEGAAGPVVVHVVQHVLHPPAELKAWPEGRPESRLVFITRGLPRAPVAALFAAIGALQAPRDTNDAEIAPGG